jgi:hypothetical protein
MSDTPRSPSGEDPADPAYARPREDVTSYVDEVERAWVRDSLPPRARRRLAHELEDSLHAALADGASLDEILASDPHALATEIATAEGFAPTLPNSDDQPNLRGLVAWAVGSATAMAAFVWFFALNTIANLVYDDSSTSSLLVTLIIVYAICGALTLGAAARGMAHYLRSVENTRGTVALATTAMALTGGVGVALCVGIGRLTNYSSAPGVILVYILVVGTLMAAGIAAAWRSRPPLTDPPRPASGPGPGPVPTRSPLAQ